MKSKKNLFINLILIFSIIFCSCGDLSRSSAKKLISQRLNFKERNITKRYQISTFNGKIRKTDRYDTEEEKYINKMLSEKGYITLLPSVPRVEDYIELNPKVQPFIYNENGLVQNVHIVLATVGNINITGISGSDTYKKVEFDIVYALTDVGKDISYQGSLIRHYQRNFKKDDNGWRND